MTPREIRFAADGMLQSLGAWLRLLGYDCADADSRTARQRVECAAAENRVFLTRNAHLGNNLPHELLRRVEIMWVAAEHLPSQLAEVVAKFALDTEHFVFTRCVGCNEPLHPVPPAEALACVPPAPTRVSGEREFWGCSRCGKVFWRGSHVRNSLACLRNWLGTTAVL